MGALLNGTALLDSGRRAAGMSVTDAAKAIGLSRSTIQRRLRNKDWPGAKSGRKWLVSTPFVQAVTDLLEGNLQLDLDVFAANWIASGASAQSSSAATARYLAPEVHIPGSVLPQLQEAIL